MFTILNQTDYALLIIEHLTKTTGYVPISQVVQIARIPKRFASRIAVTLAKHKILASKEGINGGYKLAQSINEITLYDLFKIFEGDVAFSKCAHADYKCRFDSICQHSSFLKNTLQNTYITLIKNLTLKQMTTLQLIK